MTERANLATTYSDEKNSFFFVLLFEDMKKQSRKPTNRNW